MNHEQEIIELLTRTPLDVSDQSRIQEILTVDSELKKYENLIKLLKIFDESGHIHLENLSEYILYEAEQGKDFNKNLYPYAIMESHIAECQQCLEEYELLKSELIDIESFMNEKIIPDRLTRVPGDGKNKFWDFIFSPLPKYSFGTVIGGCAVYLILFLISNLSTPEHLRFDAEKHSNGISITRGRTSVEFHYAMTAFSEKDYRTSIKYLEDDINNNPYDPTLFYSYYIKGLVHLHNAEDDYLGLFPSFSPHHLRESISCFDKSIILNSSGKFDNISLDAHYFLAKAYLILDEFEEAKKHLKIVVEENGEFSSEASAILMELN